MSFFRAFISSVGLNPCRNRYGAFFIYDVHHLYGRVSIVCLLLVVYIAFLILFLQFRF